MYALYGPARPPHPLPQFGGTGAGAPGAGGSKQETLIVNPDTHLHTQAVEHRAHVLGYVGPPDTCGRPCGESAGSCIAAC